MAKVILVYGHPASGKTYALRNLDPKTTIIIDADSKYALPWRGWKKNWINQQNYFPTDDIQTIINWIDRIGATDCKRPEVTTLIVDGLNTAMSFAKYFNPDRTYNGWLNLGQTIINIIRHAKNTRDDLTVVFNAHVEIANPDSPSAIDKIKTPGKMINDVGIESLLLYVFYSRCIDGKYFFETQGSHSSARSPEGCFPPQIPNDIKTIIETINQYENGEDLT